MLATGFLFGRQDLLLVMVVTVVRVTMRDLIGTGITNIDNGYIKIEWYTGQRMIAIDRDSIAVDFGNSDDNRIAMGTLRMKLLTDLNLFRRLEHIHGYTLHHAVIMQTVTFFRINADFEFVADFFIEQRFFETGNDIAGAMQVRKCTIAGLIKNLVVVICECVVDDDDFVFAYKHAISFDN